MATATPSRRTGSTPLPAPPEPGLPSSSTWSPLSRSPVRRRCSRPSPGRADRQPSPEGCSGTAWRGSARPGPAGWASSRRPVPASSAMRSARMACHGSVTRTALSQPFSVNVARHRPDALERVPALGDREQRLGGHAGLGQVVPAGLGLGELVAVGLAADGDDHRRDALLVELAGVLQPRLEDRRRHAVVLGRTQHHDRVGDRPRVLPGRPPDGQRRRRHQQDERQHGGADDPAHEPADAHPHTS